jgi:serine/threonine-protein kinase
MNRERLHPILSLLGGALVAFVLGVVVLNGLMGLLIGHGTNVEVPDLSGLTLREATKRLEPFGLRPQVKSERPSSQFAAGLVVSQYPKPLARVKEGRRIEVILSTGIDAVPMPSLTGLTVREATFRLGEAALEPGEVVRVPSERQQRDHIVATSPGEGSAVERSAPVDFLVSEGPPPVAFVMPDLRGRSVEYVLAVLQQGGFVAGLVTTREEHGARGGAVLEHTPPPGARVVTGQAVDLVVAER